MEYEQVKWYMNILERQKYLQDEVNRIYSIIEEGKVLNNISINFDEKYRHDVLKSFIEALEKILSLYHFEINEIQEYINEIQILDEKTGDMWMI